MSAASAKPESLTNKEMVELLQTVHDDIDLVARDIEMDELDSALKQINRVILTLESQPDAERTALKELKGKVEEAKTILHDWEFCKRDINHAWMAYAKLGEIDAQERANEKA